MSWAAQLHEIGGVISHADHHKHGAYIIDHSEVFGFSDDELHRLGLLILGQKGKLKKLDTDWSDERFCRMLLSLRVAIILCHARTTPEINQIVFRQLKGHLSFELFIPSQWSDKYPQSTHLLKLEQTSWEKTSASFAIKLTD